jgi:hypothetical protein
MAGVEPVGAHAEQGKIRTNMWGCFEEELQVVNVGLPAFGEAIRVKGDRPEKGETEGGQAQRGDAQQG